MEFCMFSFFLLRELVLRNFHLIAMGEIIVLINFHNTSSDGIIFAFRYNPENIVWTSKWKSTSFGAQNDSKDVRRRRSEENNLNYIFFCVGEMETNICARGW